MELTINIEKQTERNISLLCVVSATESVYVYFFLHEGFWMATHYITLAHKVGRQKKAFQMPFCCVEEDIVSAFKTEYGKVFYTKLKEAEAAYVELLRVYELLTEKKLDEAGKGTSECA